MSEWRQWLQQNRYRAAEWALACIAGALTLWVLAKAVNYWMLDESDNQRAAVMRRLTSENDGQGTQTDSSEANADSDEVELAKAVEKKVDRIKETPLFAPPEPTGFQGRLTGIIGDQAIFNKRHLKSVGESYRGAEVLEIGPDWVRIDFKGEKKRLWAFDSRDRGRDRPARRRGPPDRERRRGPRRSGPTPADAGQSKKPDDGRERSGNGPRRVPQRMLDHLKQMDPERREKFLNRLPDEIAERVRAAR